jgi:WD40 repeat protein
MPQNYNISEAMISYSRKDKEFVTHLEQALRDAGREIWVDWEDIVGTIDWWAEIKAGIEAAHSFIFVITPNSIRSEICRQEIEHAVKSGKRLIPIMREEPTEQVDKDRMHPALGQHNWIGLREADDFRTGVKTLIKTLETDVEHARAHTRLLVRAREWEDQGHKPSLLLRGDDLTNAEAWLASGLKKEPEPTALQAEFIAASRKAATRSRQFVLTTTMLTMLILGLLSALALSSTAGALDANNGLATQQSVAGTSIADAKYAEGQATLIAQALKGKENDAATAQSNAATSGKDAADFQLTANAAATNAGLIQLTADSAATNAVAIQLTSDSAATAASGAQATAGTAVANLQLTSDAAGEDAAAAKARANAAGTDAALANQQARDAQARADAAGTAASAANASAVAAQQTAVAIQQIAAAQGTAAAIARQTADAQLTNVAKTLAAQNTQSALTLTEVAQKVIDAKGTAEALKKEAERAVNLSLITMAQNALTAGDRPLAMHLALLAISRPGLTEPPLSLVEQTFYKIANSDGLRKTLLSSTSYIHIAYNPNTNQIAIGRQDGTIEMRDAGTEDQTHLDVSYKYESPVSGVAFSPSGQYLVTVSETGKAHLWNLVTGSSRSWNWDTGANIKALSVNNDGTRITEVSDSRLIIWTVDRDSTREIASVNQIYIDAAAISQDGTKIITSRLGAIVVWDVGEKSITNREEIVWNPTSTVLSVAFSPDGLYAASGDNNGFIYIWNISTGEVVGPWPQGVQGGVTGLAFRSDGSYLVSGLDNGLIHIWDVNTGRSVGTPLISHTAKISELAFINKKKILSSAWDGTVRISDASFGQLFDNAWAYPRFGEAVSITFSPDGRRIAAGFLVADRFILRLWDADSGSAIGAPKSFILPRKEPDNLGTVVFSPKGTYLAVALSNGIIKIWNTDTIPPFPDENAKTFTIPSEALPWVNDIAFSPDEKYLIVATGSYTPGNKGEVVMWQVSDAKWINTVSFNTVVQAVSFPPKGTCSAPASGSCLVAAGFRDQTVRLLDLGTSTHEVFPPWRLHNGIIYDVAFSPDGKYIVSASSDRTLRMWNTITGKPEGGAWIGHTNELTSVAFSPDGKRVVSASRDNTVRLWDAATGQPLGAPWIGHTYHVNDIAFSPDGTRVVSASGDSTLRMWDVRDLPELILWTCANQYGRYMTPGELATYEIKQDILSSQCAAIDNTASAAATVLQADSRPDRDIALAEATPELTQEATQEPTQEPDPDAVHWIPSEEWIAQEDGWLIEGKSKINRLISDRAVDLSEMTDPQLQFLSLLEAGVSLGTVQYSTDGITWELLASLSSADSRIQSISLPSQEEQPVWLQFVWFYLETDPEQLAAWHISSIELTQMEAAPLLPTEPVEGPVATLDVLPTIEVLSTEEPVEDPVATLDVLPTIEVLSTEEPTSVPPTGDTVGNWIPFGTWVGEGTIWQVAGGTTSSTLTSYQPFDLAGMTAPQLSFNSLYNGTARLARVYIRRGGADWDLLFVAPTTPTLSTQTLDLSAYIGQSIELSFVWAADEMPLNTESWQISDIAVAEAEITVEIDPSIPVAAPTFTPSPTAFIAEPPILSSPTPFPIMLPVFASMDDGAVDWSVSEGWTLSDALYNDQVSQAWHLSSHVSEATLNWTSTLDLRQAIRPQLYFHSKMDSVVSASVLISIDQGTWLPLAVVAPSPDWTMVQIDLSPYVGHVIRLQWDSMLLGTPRETVVWMIDNVAVMEAPPNPDDGVIVQPVPAGDEAQPVLPTPSITPSLTPTMTLMPTATETPIPPLPAVTVESVPAEAATEAVKGV